MVPLCVSLFFFGNFLVGGGGGTKIIMRKSNPNENELRTRFGKKTCLTAKTIEKNREKNVKYMQKKESKRAKKPNNK